MADKIAVTLELKDVQKFISDSKASRNAVNEVTGSVEKLDRSARSASTGGSGLLSLKNVLGGYWLSQAAIGAAHATASIVSFGVKSASSLEQAQIGFTTMLGSASKAKSMLADLSSFAAKTPFELSNLRSTASMMLGMGFNARAIIPDLTAVGDAMSGLGRGQEDVQGVLMALGQMKAHGIADAGDLLQLTSRGINSWQIMADTMHKSIPEVQKMVAKGLIPANSAIDMIVNGLEKGTKNTQKFGGMMAAQSLTLAGLASNAKDYAAQLATAVTVPFMPVMKAGLTGVNNWMQTAPARATRWMGNAKTSGSIAWSSLKHGDAFGAAVNVDRIFGGTGAITGPLTSLIGIGISIKAIWSGSVVPAFRTLRDVLAPFSAVLAPIRFLPGVFDLLAKHATTVKVALVAVGLIFAGFKVYKTAIGIIRAFMFAQAALNAVMSANPIALVVLAIAALVVGIIYAYRHSERFRLIVKVAMFYAREAIGWVIDKLSALGVWVYKVGSSAGRWLSGMWDGMKDGFKSVVNWIIDKWDWLASAIGTVSIPGTDVKFGLPTIQKLAAGGTATSSGLAIVGENGPELRYLPRGASIIPLPRSASQPAAGGPGGPREAVLQVDGRELARAVFRGRDQLVARMP